MKNKKSFLALCALFVLLLGGACVLYVRLSSQISVQTLAPSQPPAVEETQEPGKVESSDLQTQKMFAPDFTVLDSDGNEVRLSDFRGKPVVLSFWATWCGYCKMHMPVFEDAYQRLGEDVHFLMVNLTGGQETLDGARSFIDQSGYTFPVCFDTEFSAAIAYGTTTIPITFFIDAEGYPVVYGQGALNAEALQTGLDMIYSPK